jgi:uncharacterized protein YaaQ
MKMIVCIIHDIDKDNVMNVLNEDGLQVTLLPSMGGFFRKGNCTLLIGTDDDCVDQVIQKIKMNCQQPEDPQIKSVTVFVLNAYRYELTPRIH